MSAFLFSIGQFVNQVKKTPDTSSQILYIEGDGNYSTLFFSNGQKVLSAHTLAYFEGLLSVTHFVRLHKSYLVNMAYIKTLGDTEAQLTNGGTVPIARRRRKELIEKNSNYGG